MSLNKFDGIAQRFQLPERRAKVQTMSKSSEKQVYCICKTSDISRFMICCDKCDEWYHGHCINLREKDAKYISKFYCLSCKAKQPELKVRYKSKYKEKVRQMKIRQHEARALERRKALEATDAAVRIKLEPVSTARDSPQPTDLIDFHLKHEPRSPNSFRSSDTKSRPLKRKDLNNDDLMAGSVSKKARFSDSSAGNSTAATESLVAALVKSEKALFLRDRDKCEALSARATDSTKSTSERLGGKERGGGKDDGRTMPTMQCFGPQCVNAARAGSKYCSDECGLRLADLRLQFILTRQWHLWQSLPSSVEADEERQLHNLLKQQQQTRARLQRLTESRRRLDSLITFAKRQTIVANSDDQAEGGADGAAADGAQRESQRCFEPKQDGGELYVFCVTCGHAYNPKAVGRHMERCFTRYEATTSFASLYKSKAEGNLFCDAYNAQTKTYCKRLRVICAEHFRENRQPAGAADEVCGYPLLTESIGYQSALQGDDESAAGAKSLADLVDYYCLDRLIKAQPPLQFCAVSARKCQQHCNWENLRRAEIDMELVRVYVRLDELVDQERLLRTASLRRNSNLFGVMLHTTERYPASRTASPPPEAALAAHPGSPLDNCAAASLTNGFHQSPTPNNGLSSSEQPQNNDLVDRLNTTTCTTLDTDSQLQQTDGVIVQNDECAEIAGVAQASGVDQSMDLLESNVEKHSPAVAAPMDTDEQPSDNESVVRSLIVDIVDTVISSTSDS